jgi:hypothetical protein
MKQKMKLKETKLKMFWEELHNAFKPLHVIPTWGVDLKINNHHMKGPSLKIFHIMQYLNLDVILVTIKKSMASWSQYPHFNYKF